MINFDKFLASFITEMKKYQPITCYNLPACIKKALEDQGLEYKDGEIVKTQDIITVESEDEKIRKRIIQAIKIREKEMNEEWSDEIAWLEKQGQKSAELHKEDEQNLNACLGYIPDEFLRKWLTDIIHIKDDKSSDNLEPKFKVGDFIKHNKANIIYRVVSVNSGSYYVNNIDTNGGIELFNAEKNFHLWDIKDAKPGDILAVDVNTYYLSPFVAIFKEQDCEYFNSYCFIGHDGKFYTAEDGHANDYIHPATKEQCNLLFQKMHEAGYTFDFEKKELKKLKFRVGDEIITENEESLTITRIDEEGYWSNDLFICDFDEECIWDLVEQKSAWSENDEETLDSILNDIKQKVIPDENDVQWLKSIKKRISYDQRR